MTEHRCPYCGKSDTLKHYTADYRHSYFCDLDEYGCGASGPFMGTKKAALEAFCKPAKTAKRIAKLENAIRDFVGVSVESYKDAPENVGTWPVQIDRDMVDRSVKALENESEETT